MSWHDATEFCKWLSTRKARRTAYQPKRNGNTRAAQGTRTKFAFGDDERHFAGTHSWATDAPGAVSHPVGQKLPNAWGLLTSIGNVGEWLQDWSNREYYKVSPTQDPPRPTQTAWRVIRGGCIGLGIRWQRVAARTVIVPSIPGRHSWLPCGEAVLFLVREGAPTQRAHSAAHAPAPKTPPVGKSPDDKACPPATPVPQAKISPPASALPPEPQVPAKPSTPTGPEPPRAVAPFDAEKAKEHQEAWAKHLGVPVEITNSIGMKLVLIPPGEFMMGSPDSDEGASIEKPQHPCANE